MRRVGSALVGELRTEVARTEPLAVARPEAPRDRTAIVEDLHVTIGAAVRSMRLEVEQATAAGERIDLDERAARAILALTRAAVALAPEQPTTTAIVAAGDIADLTPEQLAALAWGEVRREVITVEADEVEG